MINPVSGSAFTIWPMSGRASDISGSEYYCDAMAGS
jgi:hypothetical protein